MTSGQSIGLHVPGTLGGPVWELRIRLRDVAARMTTTDITTIEPLTHQEAMPLPDSWPRRTNRSIRPGSGNRSGIRA
jgi:hypothetical protein